MIDLQQLDGYAGEASDGLDASHTGPDGAGRIAVCTLRLDEPVECHVEICSAGGATANVASRAWLILFESRPESPSFQIPRSPDMAQLSSLLGRNVEKIGYSEVFAIVERDVKPERLKNNRKTYRDYWWQYAEKRPAMVGAIKGLDRVLVVARVSKTGLPLFVPTGQVMSEQTVVFATDRTAHLALLSSGIHYAWAIARASSLKGDLRYTPSDVYETLPQPQATERMEGAGETLENFRGATMMERQTGLTKLYSLVHDASVHDSDIVALRHVHREIDEAVLEAYGWQDLNPSHGFYSTRQGERFTVASPVRSEILDRVLELNHAFHRSESPARPTTVTASKNAGQGSASDTLF
ncbi:type IIL restriction-modification enzyme MmeI [Streptomyces hebeiensis]